MSWVLLRLIKYWRLSNPLLQQTKSKWCWIAVSEYETQTPWFQPIPNVLLPCNRSSGAPDNHWHESWVTFQQIQLSIFAYLVGQFDSAGDVEYLYQNMRQPSLIDCKAAALAGHYSMVRFARESWADIAMTVIVQLPNPCSNKDCLCDIEFSCRNIELGFTYSMESSSLCRHIIVVRTHLRFVLKRVEDWDTARVFITMLQPSPLDICWAIIQVQIQLKSAIHTRIIFLHLTDAKFDMLWLIMDVSVQPRNTSTVTISFQTTCTPVYSALYIVVCFILIMFPSALNQWMLCTHIVIYQHTVY